MTRSIMTRNNMMIITSFSSVSLLDEVISSSVGNLLSSTATLAGINRRKPTIDSRRPALRWVTTSHWQRERERAFGVTSIVTQKWNSWKLTPVSMLGDIKKACVEDGHGGLHGLQHERCHEH